MVSISALASTCLTGSRRVMKYTLIFCQDGQLEMKVDDQVLTLRSGDVLTITSGQIHEYLSSSAAAGYVLEFTLDYFCKDDQDVELVFHNGLFCHFGMTEVIAVDNDLLNDQVKQIQQELEQEPYQYRVSVHARIKLILVAINRAKVERGDEIWKPDALFLKFLEMIRSNFGEQHPVSTWAQRLGTTEAKLNELSREHAGKTAQAVIHGLISSEARRLLTYEKLTVKEVAYRLGFNDPFYFSNFFKKQSGQSPSAYQAEKAV